MANEIKQRKLKKYSIEEKTKIVTTFRDQIRNIYDPEKCIKSVQSIIKSLLSTQGYINLEISKFVSPYMIGEALIRLNRNSSRGLDEIDIYHRMKKGIRVCRAISKRVQNGKYSPSPYKIIEFVKDPSDPSRTRKIGIFSTTEKVIQTLLKCILEPIYEPEFLSNSFAYRPGKSPQKAFEWLSEGLKSGDYKYCIKIDIKKYFDSIDHEPLLRILEEKVKSPEILSYIEEFLKSSKLEKYQFIENSRGTPQGSVLGPLLSNIYLHEILDKPVKDNFPEILFVRFADDIIFFSKSKEETFKLLRFVTVNLKKYNLGISDKIRKLLFDLEKDEIHFLGYTISKTDKGIQITPNEMRIIERCEKYLNIFYETISTYKDDSVIDLREYKQEEIPVSVRNINIFYLIDRFKSSIQLYRNQYSDESNILTNKLEEVKLELKTLLFNNITDRKRIWDVIHYYENRMGLGTSKREEKQVVIT
ncbi:hypothetical protein CH352_00880 [Leptospira hartskeerlii]|uniref:Reverse transcriptase domain-containing protein n=1 Tax=Leptospira hartskeerlii TaxID=2023177 RepID=A0A2M9X8D2_9LEPT|nr:reverse transcriptase domain-containing protein [Leptospira hartskeerlii]PJZ23958.1 hypothetical protein CH357_18460 [Leptospira hartskeerlii]PJZ35222.1 hypothetical protein CH352_00880 [Leptospira hartskeerlii]